MFQTAKFRDDKNVNLIFPGPQTLYSSRIKWGAMTLICGLSTAGSIAIIVKAEQLTVFVFTFLIFVTAACWLGVMIGIAGIFPGGSELRLDKHGFEITKLFVFKKIYRWNDVSDFAVWSFKYNSMVVFKTADINLSKLERINAVIAGGGRNGYLPDNYGMSAKDLVQTMNSCRNLAMNMKE